jgi:hypothetical protein
MERSVDEVGEGHSRRANGRNPPYAEPAVPRVGDTAPPGRDVGRGEADSCIAGAPIPTTDIDHRGVLSDVEFPELFDALHEIEQFVRRNPWPMLALGFAAGYWLSRSKAR